MPPRHRPFYPEPRPELTQENNIEINQPPGQIQENSVTSEQQYIDSQIKDQVQVQIQEYILSQNQTQPMNQIKLPDAAKFDGNVAEYTAFMANMNLFFWGSPETFTLDRNKILFVGTHLLGTASTWFGSLVTSSLRCLDNYPEFIQEFRNNFSDPSHSIKARGLIRSCKQGSRSASTYATEFRALVQESGFENTALVDQFLRGLSPKIIQYLMVADLPDTLEENIALAVRADNRIYTVNTMNDRVFIPNSNPFRPPVVANSNPNQNPQTTDKTVYMEVDSMTTRPRGPLSEKEKTRRYELGLFLYCGGNGHIALDCTRRKGLGKARTQQ
ncbi:Retrotransposon-derived protein PEG10 [Smittium culicis]|uniref:Retrotransposon-derived protein PEG10 n=1 Tax=Smittium culicis TaxID=133412 RepID=A0A1R1YIU7_9FUNG|nr:Retrotransposon-derived protein PEG10 [Smittium culicis]